MATHWACQGRARSLRNRGPAAAIGLAERAGPRPRLQEPVLTLGHRQAEESSQRPHEKEASTGPGRHPHSDGTEPWATWRGQFPLGFPTAARLQGICRPQGICAVQLPLQGPWASHSEIGPDCLGASADIPGVWALGEGAPQMRSRPCAAPTNLAPALSTLDPTDWELPPEVPLPGKAET